MKPADRGGSKPRDAYSGWSTQNMRNIKIILERNMSKNGQVLCIKDQARWQEHRKQ